MSEPFKDFCLCKDTLSQFWDIVSKIAMEGGRYRVTIKRWREKRSLSQNALQHVIYAEVSEYLIHRGRLDWTEKKTKRELKNEFLGWVDIEFTNVKTGEITIKQELRETSGLDKGESFNYTTQIIDWAQSIGCEIKIPATCEYRSLTEMQNG